MTAGINMTKFFYNLTNRNWGFPYHFIIANQLTFWLLRLFPQYPGFVCFGIVLLGAVYEVYQFKKKQNNRFDFITDMIANLLGLTVAIFQ